MKEDPNLDLETRLCQDAERVMATQNHVAPIAELLQRHDDRSRRRKLVRSAGVLLLAVVLPAAWVASGLLWSQPREIAPAGKMPQVAPRETLVVETPPSAPESAEPNRIVDPDSTYANAGVRPIVLVRINAEGEQVSIPGWYIPERSESIDFSLLSPAQQRAAREVLGLKKRPETRRPI